MATSAHCSTEGPSNASSGADTYEGPYHDDSQSDDEIWSDPPMPIIPRDPEPEAETPPEEEPPSRLLAVSGGRGITAWTPPPPESEPPPACPPSTIRDAGVSEPEKSRGIGQHSTWRWRRHFGLKCIHTIANYAQTVRSVRLCTELAEAKRNLCICGRGSAEAYIQVSNIIHNMLI